MAQKKGRLLLLKKESTPGSGTFDTNVCGFNARQFTLGNNMVDATLPDCTTPGGVVEEALVYGNQSFGFSGSGRFTDDASHKAVFTDALNQNETDYQVEIPGLGTVEGSFLVENYEGSGEAEGNMEFSASFRCNGAKTFTAE